MYKNLRDLFFLISDDHRKKFILLQFLVIIMAIMEVLSIILLGVFLSSVGDVSTIQDISSFRYISELLSLEPGLDQLFYIGILTLFILVSSGLISMYTTWKLSMFGAMAGAEIGNRLYRYYLKQDWLFHTEKSSSSLANKIVQEAGRVSGNIISPVMQMNGKLVSGLLMGLL